MSASQSLAPRPPASLETLRNIFGSLVARYRQEEVLAALGDKCLGSTHRMPLRTLRRLFQGRPRPSLRHGGSGMRASRIAHWRSVSSRALSGSIGFTPENCHAVVRKPSLNARKFDDDEPCYASRVSSSTVISGRAPSRMGKPVVPMPRLT